MTAASLLGYKSELEGCGKRAESRELIEVIFERSENVSLENLAKIGRGSTCMFSQRLPLLSITPWLNLHFQLVDSARRESWLNSPVTAYCKALHFCSSDCTTTLHHFKLEICEPAGCQNSAAIKEAFARARFLRGSARRKVARSVRDSHNFPFHTPSLLHEPPELGPALPAALAKPSTYIFG